MNTDAYASGKLGHNTTQGTLFVGYPAVGLAPGPCFHFSELAGDRSTSLKKLHISAAELRAVSGQTDWVLRGGTA